MQARMKNPALVLGAMQPVQALFKAIYAGGADPVTLELVHLRASQVNGCSACVDSGAKAARKAGETDERLAAVAAWREAPYFTGAERAALALAEAATRLADRLRLSALVAAAEFRDPARTTPTSIGSPTNPRLSS